MSSLYRTTPREAGGLSHLLSLAQRATLFKLVSLVLGNPEYPRKSNRLDVTGQLSL
jgi:hypothetical protein